MCIKQRFPTKKGVCNEKIVIHILLAFKKIQREKIYSALRFRITPSGSNKKYIFCTKVSYMANLKKINLFLITNLKECRISRQNDFGEIRVLCVQVNLINT